MYDKRIFNPDKLGSEDEVTALPYEGFAILAHVNAQNYAQVVQWAKHNLKSNGIEFSEQDNRYFISWGSDDRAVELFPEKTKYKDDYSPRAETYNMIIRADFWGFKLGQEKRHQDLCKKIVSLLSTIRRKRVFLVRGGKRFPIT